MAAPVRRLPQGSESYSGRVGQAENSETFRLQHYMCACPSAKAGGNQGTLHDDVRLFLDDPASEVAVTKPLVEADHGRIETRTATVSTDIEWLQKDHQWPGLAAIGKVVRIREASDKTTTETAYYLLSKALSAERFNEVVRHHWGVENRLHWRLDVIMNEDQDRTRLGNGPHNLAVLRHMALNAMQKDAAKGSLRGKFKRAGWDDAYLVKLLALF